MQLPKETLLQNGRYKIIRYISKGGFGCTYEGVQTLMGVRVAIKELFVEKICNRETDYTVSVGTRSMKSEFINLKQRFIKEATLLFKMRHPNIIRVTEVFEENGTAYYVMDYVEGRSLADILGNEGARLSEEEALSYIRQVCKALKYVHSQNILHLDIKPSNIMVDNQGNAILIDFGASKYYDEKTGEQTSILLRIHSPVYSPLEQINVSFTTFNPAADIYSLGATLYRMLTGINPICAQDRLVPETVMQPLPANVSESTRKAVEAAMQIFKVNRPQTIEEFESILNQKVFDNGHGEEITILDKKSHIQETPQTNQTKISNDLDSVPLIGHFPQSNGFLLTLFKVNGIDHTWRQGEVPLYPGDRLSMRIEGKKTQRPIVQDNVALEEILQKGLIRKVGQGYEFLPVYILDYLDFNIRAHVSGNDNGTIYRHFAIRSMDDPRILIQGAQFDQQSGTFIFPINGKLLSRRFQLIYSVIPNFSVPTLIIEVKEVDVNKLIESDHTLDLSVNKHFLNFVYPNPQRKPETLFFKITSSDKTESIMGSITNPSSSFEIYLPTEFTITPNDVEFSAPGYKCRLDEKARFVIYPETVNVEVEMPRHLQLFNISTLIPTFIIGDQTYKGFWEKDKCYINLPFEWDNQKCKLIIGGNGFPFEELSRTKISFKCAIVRNATNKEIGFEVFLEDNSILSHKLSACRIDVYPANIDVRISPEYQSEAIVEEKGYANDLKTKIFILSLRTKEIDAQDNKNARSNKDKFAIKLNNCESLYARVLQENNTYSLVPVAYLDTTNFKKVNPEIGQVKLLDKREREICVVNFPQSQYRRDTFVADRNLQNGFEVSWLDENRCIVTYKKNNIISKIFSSFNSKKFSMYDL